MAHIQQQILAAVVAVLAAAAIVPSGRVYLDRLDPLEAGELPAILVKEAPAGESVQPATIAGIDERLYAVSITAVVAHASEYGSRARELGLQIEKALDAATATLFALAQGGFRLDTARMILSGESKDAKAARQQIWRFTYFVRSGSPDAPA